MSHGHPTVTYHHGSHDSLLRPVVPHADRPAGVNAIVVPTARPHSYLADAVDLAARLQCQLVFLCSGWADARRSVELAGRRRVRAVAVDVGRVRGMPAFKTTELLAGTRFEHKTDISVKRNVGLVLARMVGWSSVLFLDDDIHVADADDVRAAAALIGKYAAVGLANAGYPDNSVVCHAYRRVGGDQGQFVGGGAMVVAGRRTESFFPTIYNEDWFYLLNDLGWLSAVTVTGRVDQKAYDPFRTPERARGEEFGDCLAEGVFALLDDGKRVRDAVDERYWQHYLGIRRQLICDVLEKLPSAGLEAGEERRIREAVRGAKGRSEHITPRLCVEYLDALHGDRKRFQNYLRRLPSAPSAVHALTFLGLHPHVA
jgi:hypothetical protein